MNGDSQRNRNRAFKAAVTDDQNRGLLEGNRQLSHSNYSEKKKNQVDRKNIKSHGV